MSEGVFLQLEQEIVSLPVFQLKVLRQRIDQEIVSRSEGGNTFFSDQDIPASKKAFFDAIGKLHFDKDEAEKIRNMSRI